MVAEGERRLGATVMSLNVINIGGDGEGERERHFTKWGECNAKQRKNSKTPCVRSLSG